MPERQPSSGEAIEQQVTPPGTPDDGAGEAVPRDGAAPDGAGRSTAPGESTSAASAPSGGTTPAPAGPGARPSPAPRPPMGSGTNGATASGPEGPASTTATDRTPADGDEQATSGVGSPAAASSTGSPAAAPAPTSDAGSQPPSADAHDGAVPSPTAPGRDPGPQAGPELFSSPAESSAPTTSAPATSVPTGAAPAAPAPKASGPTVPAASAPGAPAAGAAGRSGQSPTTSEASPAGPATPGARPAAAAGAQNGSGRYAGPRDQVRGPNPGPQQQSPAQQTPAQQSPAQQSPRPQPGPAGQKPPGQNPAGQNAGAPNRATPAAAGVPAGTRPTGAPPGNGPGNGPSTGGAELFGSWDDESTRVMPRVPNAEASTQRMRAMGPPGGPGFPGAGAAAGAGVAAAGAGAATAAMAAVPGGGPGDTPAGTRPAGGPPASGPPPASPGPSGGGDGPTDQDPDAGGGSGRPRRFGLLIGVVVVGIVVLAYLGDLMFSMGSVPRGVTVAGQDIGGLSRAAAIEKLQKAIEPRSGQPVQVTAGPVRSEIDPKKAGLSVDYDGTLDRAGSQSLNPITRVSSFFTTRDVGVVNKADTRSVRTALEQLVPLVDRAPKDGTVRFDGLEPVPVAPEPGQHLDVDAAVGTLERQWASGAPVALPLIIEQAATTPGDVQQAIDDIAKPAVSAPLTVTGEGANATVAPEDIAKALTFKADPDGAQKLVPQINVESITDVVSPQLARTEKPGVDAALDFATNPPRVIPSQDGRGIDYKATFANLLPVLTGTGPRTVPAVYTVKPPDITTAEIQSLGNAGEISSFTTGGFAADSGQNIKRAAEAIDGQIVQPGETFSLNGATDPRDASRGYVEAGIIEDGHPARGVGGGVSQLATTLYNASYFAGMVDVEHKEHSYYISRYPVAREATVFENLIDVKFRNDGPTAVMIKTAWTPSNVTVKFFGTKRYEVSSQTGPKTNFTDPQVVRIPAGQPCSPSKGSPGFTATDTRTMRDVQTGETTSKTRTVRYNPQPIVQCG